MNKYIQKKNGITLLEVLLVLATIVVIAAMSLPVYGGMQVKNSLAIQVNTVAQNLRRAQTLSQAVDGDTTWGVYLQSGSITMFQGASYASRDVSFDEVFVVPTNIVFSGVQEVVFTKFTGLPETTGTISLTSINDETKNLTINEKGLVSY